MTAWLIASIGGVALALLPYGWREPRDVPRRAPLLAERALGTGRPLVLITDGELDDANSLPSFPAGSRVEVIGRPPRRDVGVVSLEAPRAVVSGDTLEARVTVRNGALAAPGGSLGVLVNGRLVARLPLG